MTRALVTGGAGLIGSHVVDALRADGVPVRVVDALVAPTHRRRPDWLRDDVEYVFGDIRDPRVLRGAVRDVDLLFHLAAFGGFAPGTSPYFDVNVTAYCRLLEAAETTGSPLRRAVVASSQAVYGEGAARCAEHGRFDPRPRCTLDLDAGRWEVRCPVCGADARSCPTPESAANPMTPYALSKYCLEQVAIRLGTPRGIDTTVLRFALTYGSRQSATTPYCGIVALFSQRMLRDRPIVLYEDGAQTRDFVHVSDVARAHLHVAADERAVGRVYNVGTGTATSIAEVVETLGELHGVTPRIERPGWYRFGEVRHLTTDAGALRALGWAPRVALADGLSEFARWFGARPMPEDPLPEGMARMRAAGVIRSARPASRRQARAATLPAGAR